MENPARAPASTAGSRIAGKTDNEIKDLIRSDPSFFTIPKEVHFIWMGTLSIQPRGEVKPEVHPSTGEKIAKFQLPQVISNANRNKDCSAILWVDAFTMASSGHIQEAIALGTGGSPNSPLWTQYNRWSALAKDPAGPNGFSPNAVSPTERVKLREPSTFLTIVNMLREVRKHFVAWLTVPENLTKMKGKEPLSTILAQCLEAERAHEYPPTVRFLDLEVYPRWMKVLPTDPTTEIVNWVFFELYMRGRNYGAASDLIRVQLLLDQGGIYIDHDDKIEWLHDTSEVHLSKTGFSFEGFCGFRFAAKRDMGNEVPVNSFFACAANHPFMLYYRSQILADYKNLLARNYRWFDRESRYQLACGRYTEKMAIENPCAEINLDKAPRQDNQFGAHFFDFIRGQMDNEFEGHIGDAPKAGNILGGKRFSEFTVWTSGPSQLHMCIDEAVRIEAGLARDHAKTRFGSDLYNQGLMDKAHVEPGFSGAWI